MRVLSILAHSPPARSPGGAEEQMHSLHVDLRRQGVDVSVLADQRVLRCEHMVHDGVPIWTVPMPVLTSHRWRPGNLRIARTFWRMLDTVSRRIGRPDVIVATPFREAALCADWLGNALETPWIARVACSGSYGDFAYMEGNWMTREMLPGLAERVAATVILDDATRAEARAHGIPLERLVSIPNAIRWDPAGTSGLNGPRDRIVFVGRVSRQKRVDIVIRAYTALRRNGLPIPPLDIVGSGDELANCERLVQLNDLVGRVQLHGYQTGVVGFLARARCYVSSSESEGFPNAVLEACSVGVPVILSDIPVHREIASAVGMLNFIFPCGDTDALAGSLQRFFSIQPSALDDLRRRAQAYASRFTRMARNGAYVDLLTRAAAGDRSA